MIIAIDGLPGAGKTTVVEYICRKYPQFRAVDQIIDNDIKVKNQYYYLKSDKLKYANAEKLSSEGFHVLLDRSHVSTLFFNFTRDKLYGFKSYENIRRLTKKNIIDKYIFPDFYIYINVPVEVGLKRKKRILGENRRYLWNNRKFLIEMGANMVQYLSNKNKNKIYFINNKGKEINFHNRIDKIISKII